MSIDVKYLFFLFISFDLALLAFVVRNLVLIFHYKKKTDQMKKETSNKQILVNI